MFFSARCAIPGTSVNVGHLRLNPNVLTAMAGGTSVEYLQRRLEKAGRFDLLEAIARLEISTYHAAELAGIIRRKPTLGLRDHEAKRRAFAARGLR